MKNINEADRETVVYKLTMWQEELLLKLQSQVTLLSKLFIPFTKTLQFPSPVQGSIPKSQSFFPNFFAISFNAFTVTLRLPNKATYMNKRTYLSNS